MNEFDAIAELRRALGGGLDAARGIGDDAALLPPSAGGVLAVDTMVAGVHFRLDWSGWADVGYKLFASNASDMLAMGARPGDWLLSVALPVGARAAALPGLIEGLRAARDDWGGGALVGGDTTSLPPGAGEGVLSITMSGAVVHEPWLRSGFRPGDGLWVDGPLGLAACGLASLESGIEAQAARCVSQHRRPAPPAWRWRADHTADAGKPGAVVDPLAAVRGGIDVSDGLAQDLWHVARASGVRLVVDRPLPGEALLEAIDASRTAAWQWAGGDDYVRVIACAGDPGPGWTRIGRVEEGAPGVVLERGGAAEPVSPAGWRHG